MFELIFNAARFIVSKDVRETSASLLQRVRRSPEWKKDLCIMEASIQHSSAEQAALLRDLSCAKLRNLDFPKSPINAFTASFVELVDNGFHHGCRHQDESIRLAIQITGTYVSLTVLNETKRKFIVKDILREHQRILNKDLRLQRGRGPLLVSQLADTLEGVADNCGVKAVIFKDRVELHVEKFNDRVHVITLASGLYNPSLETRLVNLACRYLHTDLVLDFSRWSEGGTTVVRTVILRLDELFSTEHRRILAVLAPVDPQVELLLPPELVVDSLDRALRRLRCQVTESSRPLRPTKASSRRPEGRG